MGGGKPDIIAVGLVCFWVVVSLGLLIKPNRVFRLLGYRGIGLRGQFENAFRVLGLLNLIGAIHLLTRLGGPL